MSLLKSKFLFSNDSVLQLISCVTHTETPTIQAIKEHQLSFLPNLITKAIIDRSVGIGIIIGISTEVEVEVETYS